MKDEKVEEAVKMIEILLEALGNLQEMVMLHMVKNNQDIKTVKSLLAKGAPIITQEDLQNLEGIGKDLQDKLQSVTKLAETAFKVYMTIKDKEGYSQEQFEEKIRELQLEFQNL